MFYIQTSNPKITKVQFDKTLTFSNCIEDKFQLWTEDAIIRWNYYSVPVGYVSDIGEIYAGVMDMLHDLDGNKEVVYVIFPSSSFQADWAITVKGDDLEITSRWGSVVGDIEELLNHNNTLTVNKDDFIGEWNSLLETVYNAFADDDMSECEEYQRLGEYLRTHKQRGILYREYQPME